MSDKTPFEAFTAVFAAAQQQNAQGQAKEPEPVEPLVSVADSMAELAALWGRKDAAVSTGFVQLDHLLSGGVRAGDMLALVGLAKGGKSALWGQVLFQLAAHGALGVYASVEMPWAEVTSRWIVRSMFLAAYAAGEGKAGNDWIVGYGDVLYGKVHRGEDGKGRPITSDAIRAKGQARLAEAMSTVAATGQRLFVEHLAPGSTCKTLRGIVERAKAQTGHTGPTVLLVDPIQRLFAHESEACRGTALDRMNAEETPRVGMVAQQLIGLAQDKALDLAVLFTSDTTFQAAREGGASGATNMRGSYMLNHAATAIFDITSFDNLEDLIKATAGDAREKGDAAAEDYRGRLDFDMLTASESARRLGVKASALNCTGNRRGPNGGAALTFVPGAMTFAEDPDLKADSLYGDRLNATPAKPKAAKGRKR